MKTKQLFVARISFLQNVLLGLLIMLSVGLVLSSCKKDEKVLEAPDINNRILNIQKSGDSSTLYYGHESFTRSSGNPVVLTRQLTDPNFSYFTNQFTLNIINGNGTNNRVSSAVIKIDGVQIFGPSDFSQNVSFLTKPIPNLTSNSQLEVELRGKPGGVIDLWIDGILNPGYMLISQEGGIFSFSDNITLEFPSEALSEYGYGFLGHTGEEITSVPNPYLQITGVPLTLRLPSGLLLDEINLTYTKPSDTLNIDNYAVFLFNGSTYYPVEYSFSGNNVVVIIDKLDWETNLSKSTQILSEITILGLVYKQTPPVESMGLKKVTLDANNKLQYNIVQNVNGSDKVVLLVHGWTGAPSVWDSLIPNLMNHPELGYTQYWTYGYKSSASITSNASALSNLLQSKLNGASIDIIGHSMGGLVSRSMIEDYGGSSFVDKLVTIGTPHQGSPLAAIRYVIGFLVGVEGFMNLSFDEFFVLYYKSLGLRDLYPGSNFIEKRINLQIVPLPTYSIACSNNPYDTCISSRLIEGPDDGVVSVESAQGISGSNASFPSSIKNIPEKIAHTKMTRNIDIQQQVIDYLLDNNSNGNVMTGTMTDIEGNVYKTVKIGNQWWMAENLKTTKFKTGTSIPLVTLASTWNSLSAPGYCWYNNDINNKTHYGALYNWYSVSTGNLAPAGWHIPSDAEWEELEGFVDTQFNNGDSEWNKTGFRGYDAGKHLKSASGWNLGGNGLDTYEFNILPGGYRHISYGFVGLGDYAGYWSSTPRVMRDVIHVEDRIWRYNEIPTYGWFVRCVKD